MSERKYAGIKEAALRYGVSDQTLRNLARRGLLPGCIHVGNVLRIDLEELDREVRRRGGLGNYNRPPRGAARRQREISNEAAAG